MSAKTYYVEIHRDREILQYNGVTGVTGRDRQIEFRDERGAKVIIIMGVYDAAIVWELPEDEADPTQSDPAV